MVVLGPVVQPWYLLWGLVVLAGAGLSRLETRAAVLTSVFFICYSVANSGATVPTYVFLQDGIATLISILVVLALLVASRRSRAVLLDDIEVPRPPGPSDQPGRVHAPSVA
jgi:alpha-1,6-mannosyltransferase